MQPFFRSETLKVTSEYIRELPLSDLVSAHATPFMVLDRQVVAKQYNSLREALPMVRHHFAIKALRHSAAIEAIAGCDGYFDTMTNGDLDMMRDANIPPERCLNTNPVKKPQEIEYALATGASTFVVDNRSEVDKLAACSAEVDVLVRLSFRNSGAKSDLSYKFGVPPGEVDPLVRYALDRGLRVLGLSMHVGSQIDTVHAYVDAIEQALTVVDDLERTYRRPLEVLDIGGGFPVDYDKPMPSLKEIAAAIGPTLETLTSRLEIWSEPGRYVVAPAGTLVTQVVGTSTRSGRPWYYVDDGVYGSYSNAVFEHVTPPILALDELTGGPRDLHSSVVAGPTCDSVDVVDTDCALPTLEVGDLLVSPMMGAYTTVSATRYNGIEPADIVVV